MAERAHHDEDERAWTRARALLLRRPDLVQDDLELLGALRLRPANVVDFTALARVEAARNAELSARQAVEAVAEANFQAQAQCQEAVLDLLEARNNSDLAHRVDMAARDRFGLAGAALTIEGPRAVPAGWRPLPRDGADALLGEDRPYRLGRVPLADYLFTGADLPGSVAMVRIAPWPRRVGVLAFSHPDPDGFTADMGVELIAHVAAVVERIAARWPLL